MSPKIKVTISALLRDLSQLGGEPESLDVTAPDAVECLRAMLERFPSMKHWAYDEEGALRPQIWFFVNGERLPDDRVGKPLKNGDELLIFYNHI